MRNRIMLMVCPVLLAVSVLGFTDYQQAPDPSILAKQRANEKATFDYHQRVYNNKANTQIRAKNLVDNEQKTKQQEKKNVEAGQDKTKGQFLWKF